MNKVIGFTAMILTVTSVSAATAAVYTEPSKPIVVSKSSHSFSIELAANPTTGYMWFLKNFDQDFIKIKQHYFVPPKDQKIGAPGMDVWQFEVNPKALTAPLMVELNFTYTKPWDLTDQKDTTFTVLTTDQ